MGGNGVQTNPFLCTIQRTFKRLSITTIIFKILHLFTRREISRNGSLPNLAWSVHRVLVLSSVWLANIFHLINILTHVENYIDIQKFFTITRSPKYIVHINIIVYLWITMNTVWFYVTNVYSLCFVTFIQQFPLKTKVLYRTKTGDRKSLFSNDGVINA